MLLRPSDNRHVFTRPGSHLLRPPGSVHDSTALVTRSHDSSRALVTAWGRLSMLVANTKVWGGHDPIHVHVWSCLPTSWLVERRRHCTELTRWSQHMDIPLFKLIHHFMSSTCLKITIWLSSKSTELETVRPGSQWWRRLEVEVFETCHCVWSANL